MPRPRHIGESRAPAQAGVYARETFAFYTNSERLHPPKEKMPHEAWELTLRTLSYGCTARANDVEGDSYLILFEGKVYLPSTMLSSAAWPSRFVNTSIHVLVFRKNLVSDSANTWNLGLPVS